MSEATKDLPDPLEDASNAADADAGARTSPDELVAKMADDEIDRLIAAADRGALTEPSQEQSPTDVIDEFEKRALLPDPDLDLLKPAAGAIQAADSPGLQSQLDSLFNTLDTKEPSLASPTSASTVDATPPMPPPVDVPADIANDDGHGAAETEPEHQPIDAASDAAAPLPADPDAAMRADVKALLDEAVDLPKPRAAPKFIVVPLRLLNAPFAGLSDEKRDIVGQIAIVTLINALAVMLYVVIFRRP